MLWGRSGRGHSRKKMLNNTFEAGMCMKTKDHETQCPNKNRLIVPRFRHLRRIERYFAGNLLLLHDRLSGQSRFSADFFVQGHTANRRRISRPVFGRSAGFQPASSRQDGAAGYPEHGSDLPRTEGVVRSWTCSPKTASVISCHGGTEGVTRDPKAAAHRRFVQRTAPHDTAGGNP